MARFPEDRAGVLELAHKIQNGMTEPTHVSAFSGSPVTATEIGSGIAATVTTATARQSAQSALDDATIDDQNAIKALVLLLQKLIEYARGQRSAFPEILNWIDFAENDPIALAPGLCRSFELVKRTPGLLHLDWKGPKIGTNAPAGEGGRAKLYEVVWRENAAQEWKVAATVLPSEAQVPTSLWARGATIEISVRATNLQGNGPEAASISIAL